MSSNVRWVAAIALLFLPASVWATTVHRCEDDHGQITFTTLGCPSGHNLKAQQADNPLPGSIPASAPATVEKSRIKKEQELVVVGQRDDGCGNILSAEQRRKAVINQQTPAGMTKRDVESLLGKPDKIVGRNGELRYVYKEKKGQSRQIMFDEHGCVKGKR